MLNAIKVLLQMTSVSLQPVPSLLLYSYLLFFNPRHNPFYFNAKTLDITLTTIFI
jgi:hypothetical protein